jgi:hypothetical protein
MQHLSEDTLKVITASLVGRWAAAILMMIAGGINAVAQTPYTEIEIANGGTLRGSVVYQPAGGAAVEKLMCTKDVKLCGKMKASPRLCLGKSNGVANSIVYLEGITQGKKFDRSARATLTQEHCEYSPHCVVIPLGSQLEIVNGDPILHNVHAYDEQTHTRSIFNIAQPIRGQHTVVKQTQLNKPGLISASCDAGHPWMSAYIMVAEHPYYTVTDREGRFMLENIPPGTYQVKVWHEGVASSRSEIENGKVKKYIFEEPYEMKKTVDVPSAGSVDVNFDLVLR